MQQPELVNDLVDGDLGWRANISHGQNGGKFWTAFSYSAVAPGQTSKNGHDWQSANNDVPRYASKRSIF